MIEFIENLFSNSDFYLVISMFSGLFLLQYFFGYCIRLVIGFLFTIKNL